MDHNNVICAIEFIEDRLYLAVMDSLILLKRPPKSTSHTHFFCIDNELVYENFYSDFGPLNLAMLYRYCIKLQRKFKVVSSQSNKSMKIVHYTVNNSCKFSNAVYLICSYVMLYHEADPQELVKKVFSSDVRTLLTGFRDASYGESHYTIELKDCLEALQRARKLNFFSFDDFDIQEYEKYEQVINGDFNWMLPGKFIAFCGPRSDAEAKDNFGMHTPQTYVDYFIKNNVTDVVRLNTKEYDESVFINAGIRHHNLIFIDGSYPPDRIMNRFLELSEMTTGAVAVHCRAGLGRTGSLIGCYIMKHFRFSASQTIAWLRICRPGSVLGVQQQWLESKEMRLWREGDLYRRSRSDSNLNQKFSLGIYSKLRHSVQGNKRSAADSLATQRLKSNKGKKKVSVRNVLHGVDTLQLNDNIEEPPPRKYATRNYIKSAEHFPVRDAEATCLKGLSQGERLTRIKASRASSSASSLRSHTNAKLSTRPITGKTSDDLTVRSVRPRDSSLSSIQNKRPSAVSTIRKETWRDPSRRVLRSTSSQNGIDKGTSGKINFIR